jgi:hypothetical protein
MKEKIIINLNAFLKSKSAVIITHDYAMLPVFTKIIKLSRSDGIVQEDRLVFKSECMQRNELSGPNAGITP